MCWMVIKIVLFETLNAWSFCRYMKEETLGRLMFSQKVVASTELLTMLILGSTLYKIQSFNSDFDFHSFLQYSIS
jgi:hypothetical protein